MYINGNPTPLSATVGLVLLKFFYNQEAVLDDFIVYKTI